MANKPFDQYFDGKALAVGPQPVGGDSVLILRSGTVLKADFAYVKAFAYIDENATETTINTLDVWESIAGTYVQGPTTPQFSYAAGVFTYLGPNQVNPTVIQATTTLTKAVGASESYEIGVFINGTLHANGMKTLVGNPDTKFLGCNVIASLSTGDIIEVKIRNRTNTENITVADLQFVINT